jgi:hypothetical protein
MRQLSQSELNTVSGGGDTIVVPPPKHSKDTTIVVPGYRPTSSWESGWDFGWDSGEYGPPDDVVYDGIEPPEPPAEDSPSIDWDSLSPWAKENLQFALIYAAWYKFYQGRIAGLDEAGDQIELLANFLPGRVRVSPDVQPPSTEMFTQAYRSTIIQLGTDISEAGAEASADLANQYWRQFLIATGNWDPYSGGANGFPTRLIDPGE